MMTYNDLTDLDVRPSNFEVEVTAILKDFMFIDLLNEKSLFCDAPPTNSTTKKDKKIHKDSIQKIRHSIINFLYSGYFTLPKKGSNQYDYSREALIKIRANIKPSEYNKPDIFFEPIEKSWNSILESYQLYLKKLKEKLDEVAKEGKKESKPRLVLN